MLQAAEASVGLSVEYYDPLISGNRHKHNHLQSQARAVRIVHKTIGYQDCEEHALCVAMHTYMGLLLKIAGPHFQWDEANRMPLATELGQRLLLCADIFEQYLCKRLPMGWNDGDVYLHTAYIDCFCEIFAVAVEKIRFRQNSSFVQYERLNKDDVASLQASLDAAVCRMASPQSSAQNRHLYIEMYKTKRSIDGYIHGIERSLPSAVTLLVEMKLPRGFGSLQTTDESAALNPHASVLPYMAFLKRASTYMVKFQALWKNEVLGYLVKVTRASEGEPQCVMLLFLRPELSVRNWRKQLMALEYDFNDVQLQKKEPPVSLTIHDLTLPPSKQAEVQATNMVQFIDDLFVKELRFRRLNLPKRRRSWAKGNSST